MNEFAISDEDLGYISEVLGDDAETIQAFEEQLGQVLRKLPRMVADQLREARQAEPEPEPAQPQQVQPQAQQPDEDQLAAAYLAELNSNRGRGQRTGDQIRAKYEGLGLDTGRVSIASGRVIRPETQAAPEADPLEAQYKAEVLANRGGAYQKLLEIKTRYRRQGFNPDGVSFR